MFETAIAPPVKAKLETTRPLPSLGNMFMSSVKITIQKHELFRVDIQTNQSRYQSPAVKTAKTVHYKP